MRSGRPKLVERNVEWKIMIPSSTALTVELLLLDPVREHIVVGARSRLITQLLKTWIEQQRLPFPPSVDSEHPSTVDSDIKEL